MLDKYIEQSKQEIIHKTQTLIQIPSIYEKSDNPYEPPSLAVKFFQLSILA